jgi:membrane protease subunit HflC
MSEVNAMQKTVSAVIVIAAAALLILSNALFTVDQTQYAIVLQFGEPVGVKDRPGLHLKMPFIQNVIHLDKRLMEYDVPTTIIYTSDKKNMVVDAYVRWHVDDPLLFYKRFKSDNSFSIIEEAKRRLADVIIGELKSELGLHIMSDVISQNRNSIMEAVTNGSNAKLLDENESSGLKVEDVRIKRADLPPENQQSVYERMKAERNQQATKYRSEGQMQGEKIRADANRRTVEIKAEATRKSEEIRGQADAEAAAVYATAFGRDPEFYAFVRSLETYRNAFQDGSTFVMSPDDMDFLKYLGGDEVR